MHGFDQVGFPSHIGSYNQHKAALEFQLELLIRAEIPQPELANAQPARRIGMIMYQKLSPSARKSPG